MLGYIRQKLQIQMAKEVYIVTGYTGSWQYSYVGSCCWLKWKVGSSGIPEGIRTFVQSRSQSVF